MRLPASRFMLCPYEISPSPHRHSASRYAQPAGKTRQANLKLGRDYPEPKLVYQQRGTAAGTAWLESYEIRLNPVLMMENQQAFIEEVVPHELAHLLVWKHFAASRRTAKSGNG